MKQHTKWLALLALASFKVSLFAGPTVASYWPLNGGDQRLFSMAGAPLTMVVTDDNNGVFTAKSTFEGSSQALDFEEDPDDCYITAVDDLTKVSFDTPVTFMTDALLQSGGTVRTTTGLDNGLATVTVTVNVGNAGTVTVPAGKFSNCRSVTLHVKKDSSSSNAEIITSSATTSIFAPGVGMIKTEVAPGLWAQLVNATIGGTFIGNANLAPLTVQFSGTGELVIQGVAGPITSSLNSKLLHVGQSYTAIAKGVKGSVFEGWTLDGTNISNGPELTFTMQTNLVLQANFIPNPFGNIAGNYIGLFMPYQSNTLQNSGYFSLAVTTKGGFSGYWETSATRHSISGQLSAGLQWSNSYNISGVGEVSIAFAAQNDNTLSGTVSGPTWTSSLTAVELDPHVVSIEGAGKYAISLTSYGPSGNTTGQGKAIMNYGKRGPTTLAGTLPDGTRFGTSSVFSPLAPNANCPFYIPLYGGKGYVIGWMYNGPDGGTDYSDWTATANFVWLQHNGAAVSLTANGTLQ